MRVTGDCLCGYVTYRAEGGVRSRVHCHCRACRKAGGAVAISWVTMPLDGFAFTKGEPAVYKSSPHGERKFCPRCGSPLTFWTSKDPDLIDITIVTTDQADDLGPDHHIWTCSQLPWARLDEHLPAYPESG